MVNICTIGSIPTPSQDAARSAQLAMPPRQDSDDRTGSHKLTFNLTHLPYPAITWRTASAMRSTLGMYWFSNFANGTTTS